MRSTGQQTDGYIDMKATGLQQEAIVVLIESLLLPEVHCVCYVLSSTVHKFYFVVAKILAVESKKCPALITQYFHHFKCAS